MTRPSYHPEPWQHMLLFWAVMAFAVFINVLASTVLPKFEGFILILHIVGFFAILLPLLVLGEHQDPHDVFGLWLNEGDLPTQGVSFMVGLLGPVFMFLGADGAMHVRDNSVIPMNRLTKICQMSEEIQNAPTVVPWSILFSIIVNGALAFAMMIATLFITTDLETALKSPTGYPFMEIFVQATGSVAGAATMASIITVMQLFANVGLLASCSRMSWSFARDRGLPGHKALARVSYAGKPNLTWSSYTIRADQLFFAGQSSNINPCHNHRRHYHYLHPSIFNHPRLINSFQQHRLYLCRGSIGVIPPCHRTPTLATDHWRNSQSSDHRLLHYQHSWF